MRTLHYHSARTQAGKRTGTQTLTEFDLYDPTQRFGRELFDIEDDWTRFEPDISTMRKKRGPNPWTRFKDTIRRAWRRRARAKD